jgi:hypothetical protein
MCLLNRWRRGAELGVASGRFSLFLCNIMKDMHMTAVDLWAPQPGHDAVAGGETYAGWKHEKAYETLREIARTQYYAGRLDLLRMRTDDAAREIPDASLDFVFVDADHSYEGCKADIVNWAPKVRPGGIVSGHDYGWPTVSQAVGETGGYSVLAEDNVWVRFV